MALDRDAYFTPIEDCDKIIKTALNDHLELKHLKWVEPSAGSGNFIKAAEQNGIKNVEAYDIHPLGDNIIKRDFLEEETDLNGCFVFGNPPYGKKQRLALDFIDRSFAQGAEYVGFLLLGTFTAHAVLSRIKQSCEVISLRGYSIKFIDEHGEKAKGCLANDKDVVFIILKKSNNKFKDIKFKEKYLLSTDKNDFSFSCGYKRFFDFDNTPELGETSRKGYHYIKEFEKTKKRPEVSLYKCIDNYDKELIEYLSKFFKHGKPLPNTLNFYTEYIHILKDLQ